MQIPIELSGHGVDQSDWAQECVRERAGRLERYAEDEARSDIPPGWRSE